jgi:hypothetical protein
VKKIILGVFAMLVLLSPVAQAQDQYMELMRQDLRTVKTEIVTQGMMMTGEESKAFWPVYREYQLELDKIWDARIALIGQYAEKYEMMDDETADSIMKQAFDLRKKRAKLMESNYKNMKKAVGAILAARFVQIDGVIQDLVNLQIAVELPLVMHTAPETTEGR